MLSYDLSDCQSSIAYLNHDIHNNFPKYLLRDTRHEFRIVYTYEQYETRVCFWSRT